MADPPRAARVSRAYADGMRADRRFAQLDVFTDTPTRGNPVAVVLDADGLSDAEMASFARWTNLSETTYVLPPTDPAADYRVRIFTPGGELPFAGHPTLGTCRAWLDAGGVPHAGDGIVQECRIGLVRLREDAGRLAFEAPPVVADDVAEAELGPVLAALGLPLERVQASRWLDNGPRFLGLLVDQAATVLALEPDHAALRHLPKVGLIGPHPPGAEADFEVRAFAPSFGIPEDPVTGSLNASFGQWLTAVRLAPDRYVVAQGTRLGRSGRVHVSRDGDGAIWVGGDVAPCISGTVRL